MHKISTLIPSLITAFATLLLLATWPAQATDETTDENSQYDEVTYEDLVQRIGQKKSQLADSQDTSTNLEQLQIHAGVALVSAITSINYDGQDIYKPQNGFQLSVGIDLFSENFMAEGAIRNFGISNSGSESRSLREFDLNLIYHDRFASRSGYHIGSGLGTRLFKLNDTSNGKNINDSTPSMLVVAGLDSYISKKVSIGFELGWRTALITSTVDKNSMDGTLRLDTSF